MSSKTETFVVLDSTTLNTEFIIKKEVIKDGKRKIYTLSRSDSDSWTEGCRGETLITIYDNDDEIKFKYHTFKPKKMAYHELIELNILLNFINDTSYIPSEYKVLQFD